MFIVFSELFCITFLFRQLRLSVGSFYDNNLCPDIVNGNGLFNFLHCIPDFDNL